MRVINLDFFEQKSTTFLSYKEDRNCVTINFHVGEKLASKENGNYIYELIFFSLDDNKNKTQEVTSAINGVVSCELNLYTINHISKKGYLQLRIIMNEEDINEENTSKRIGVVHSVKYPYIIEDNLDFRVVNI